MVLRPYRSSLTVVVLSIACMVHCQTTPLHHLDYPAEFTGEQVLNGDLPGRPPSPPAAPLQIDAQGFAATRLFHVPPVGVHPRVLFGPGDLPAIRERLRTTRSGRQFSAFIRSQLAKGIDRPGTWENELYNDLLDGRIDDFARLYRPQDVPMVAGHSSVGEDTKSGAKWHHRDPFGQALEMKAFFCLLDNNSTEGRRVGKAIAEWAVYYKPRVEKAAAGPFADNWWRSMRSAVDGYPFLPLSYDLAFNFMTSDEQATVRQVLSLTTKGRYTLGMELPQHWRVWNFIGISMYEVLFSLAIEGEPGHDPRIYKRTVELVRDYLSYGVNPSGMAHESVGYHSGGLEEMSLVMIAMAGRGDNFFTTDRYRAQFDNWFLQTLQPYGGEWFSDGDLGNFPAGTEATMIAKYFYPDDRKLDYVFQNLPQARKDDFGADLYPMEMLLTASDATRDAGGSLEDYAAGAAFHLPVTYADESRGVVITRNEWSKDAIYLNFECHPDTRFASHDHADRGRFVLTALGRNWAWQDSRPHETAQTNSVLIDDVGQGYFPTYANWLGYTDTAGGTFAGCDASYAYDWKWQKEAGMWPADDPRFSTPFYKPLRDNVKMLDPAVTEYDPSPQVVAFYKPYLAGNPRMWDEDSWVVRQVNNPVLYAFRSAGLVRGDQPYAVVMDDIQKDSAAHTYKWLMQLEEDLYLQHQEHRGNVREIVLAEKGGTRRLALFVLDESPVKEDAIAEHYPTEYKLTGMPVARSTMYRLTIPTPGVAFHSRVLLYAYREGEKPATVQWNPTSSTATITTSTGADKLQFRSSPDGRTLLRVQRSGKTIAEVK